MLFLLFFRTTYKSYYEKKTFKEVFVMEMYEIKDLRTKKLVREVGERMDDIALAYVDLLIDAALSTYPEGATDEQWSEFCDNLSSTFAKSLEKASNTRGL